MARSWIIDIEVFAKKVKNSTLSSDQIKDCGAYHECPKCHNHMDNSDVSPEWPGFPAGLKFDPSDVQLLEHLVAKCCVGNKEQNMFIHEFIPTLEGDQGICYTHPENLPGAKKDGSSVHFFHRTTNAYATGQRKRRKIHHQQGLDEEHVRWHKTGKTKAVIEDGLCKGFKKIMVLYIRSKKGSKPYKSNWVMHQYHLGSEEDEKDGKYVVSKIFYRQQKKRAEKNEENPMVEDSDLPLRTSPPTPNLNPPNTWYWQNFKPIHGGSHDPPSGVQDEDNGGDSAWLAGESQAVENSNFGCLDNILSCNEVLESSSLLNDSGLKYNAFNGFACNASELAINENASYGTSVLDAPKFDTPPDSDLFNLQYCSQDSSVLQWIDSLICIESVSCNGSSIPTTFKDSP